MRKKISVRDLRLGMFIEELVGNWMDHPFWRSRFLLTDPAQLKLVRDSAIAEVWIDTGRGLDVSPPAAGPGPAAETPAAASSAPLAPPPPPRVPYEEELQRARQIQAHAKQAVTSILREARMGKAIASQEAAAVVDEISSTVTRNPGALLSIVRLKTKDDYTYLHSVAVCALMVALGRQAGLEGAALRSAGLAGLLHDVGKMAVPDEVLNKPGRLTDSEWEVIRTHPGRGYEMLQASGIADGAVLDVCRHHHERVDGTGYPDRLSGEALSTLARMGAVCDVYDAVTSDRPYKQGWSPAEAVHRMAEWTMRPGAESGGGQFDERIFRLFVKVVGIYPSGTLVRLSSGRLGVVTDPGRASLLAPTVKVFFSARLKEPVRIETVDLGEAQETIEGMEDPAIWGFDLARVMDL